MLHKIRELCREKGISLAELERETGLSEKSIFSWNEVMPSADKLARVAKVLGTTVEELLESANETTHSD